MSERKSKIYYHSARRWFGNFGTKTKPKAILRERYLLNISSNIGFIVDKASCHEPIIIKKPLDIIVFYDPLFGQKVFYDRRQQIGVIN